MGEVDGAHVRPQDARGTAPGIPWHPASPGRHDRPRATRAIRNGTGTARTEQTGGACMNVDQAHTAPTAIPATGEPHSYARLHGRWPLLARGVWITVVVCTLGISLASLPVYLAQLQTPCAGSACSYQQLTPEQVGALAGLGLSLGQYAAYIVVIALINMVVCLAVSAVIALRRPDDRMAFIVALMLVTLGPLTVAESVATSPSPWGVPNQYLGNLCIALLLLVFSLFPTGRFVPRWMRWPMVVLILGVVLPWTWISLLLAVGVRFAFFPAGLSPLKIGAVDLGFVVFLIEVALLVVVQLYRYRRVSSPLQRQQTKWVVVGFAGLITCWVVAIVPYLIFPALAAPGSLYLPAFIVLQGFTLLVIPLAFGVAMLRYRLWDFDVLIRRTLVYGPLSLTLTGVYAGLVIGLQALLGGIGLIGQDSGVAIVLSTLAIVVLVQPVRRRLQALIDRRFYRRKYDAAKIVEAFSTTLRHEVDVDQLRAQVLAVVQETMQPAQVSLWLRPSPGRESGGSILHRRAQSAHGSQ
jgi:hypothetical protein